MHNLMKMNLQIFAAPDGGAGGQGGDAGGDADQNSGMQQQGQQQQTTTIDYSKIQSMIDKGTQQKENAILKSYFQQQGLSEDEAKQAMAQFKQQKAEQTPDVSAIQQQLTQVQATARQALLEKEATLEAITLGLDQKTIPYVLKMADLDGVIGEDGKVNQEGLKNALNKVLQDIPQLRPVKEGNRGFQQVGAGGGQQNTNMDDALKAAFGL